MKTCIVCGYSVEDNISECPNCGSYNFNPVRKKEMFRKFNVGIKNRFKQ